MSLLVLISLVSGATHALFTDMETNTGNTFTTACFDDAFVLSSGTSKATRTSIAPSPPKTSFPIASVDKDGNLALDFGEVPSGNSNNSPDVFRIKSIWRDTLTVQVELSDELKPLFKYIEVGKGVSSIAIDSGEEVQVAAKLNVPNDAVPGDYRGYVIVSAHNGFFMKKIPALLSVVEHPTPPIILDASSTTETADFTTETVVSDEADTVKEIPTEEEVIETNTLPVSITSPGGGAELCGTVNIITNVESSSATHRNIRHVVFYIDGEEVGKIQGDGPNSTYIYTWDTTAALGGKHTLMVEAHYTAGTEVSEEIVVMVNNS
ncbi:MAG TPA: hypothetical protein ENN38_01045 [Actinobacteria bacterium]|nr:hypothetical protein [Actinomycetota bacterium]